MKKRTWMLCVCMAAVLMFTVYAFQMPVMESASAARKTEDSRVLIAYFGQYGNTNFSKDVDAATSASIVTDGKKQRGITEMAACLIQKETGGDL